MSDRNERACRKCGSLLHHEDDCATNDGARLEEAVKAYEKRSGFSALNYRAVNGRSISEKVMAAHRDLRWFENHYHEAQNELRKVILALIP